MIGAKPSHGVEMDPEKKDLLARVGTALLVVQATEEQMRFVLRFCLPGVEKISLETLERGQSELQKKTLGQFLKLLRERVDLDDQFEQVLVTFLASRNTLVHRADEIPGWDLDTPEGRKSGFQFLSDIIRAGIFISRVFVGLIRSWAEQNGLQSSVPPGAETLFAEIDAKYKPAAGSIFFKKSETP